MTLEGANTRFYKHKDTSLFVDENTFLTNIFSLENENN